MGPACGSEPKDLGGWPGLLEGKGFLRKACLVEGSVEAVFGVFEHGLCIGGPRIGGHALMLWLFADSL